MCIYQFYFNRSVTKSSPAQNKGSEPFHKPETEQSCFGSGAAGCSAFFYSIINPNFNFILLCRTSMNLSMLGVG